MRLLLLSGFGPGLMDTHSLRGTLLGPSPEKLGETYRRLAGRTIDPLRFRFGGDGGYRLLRSTSGVLPHLPTATVRSLLNHAGIEHEWFDLQNLWSKTGAEPAGDFDVVALSSTFIWDAGSFRKVLKWVEQRFPDATFVIGGQYSNLKYERILDEYPQVDYVIRGDAEVAFPALLRALANGGDLDAVPNLVGRDAAGKTVVGTITHLIDMDAHPSPSFEGRTDVIPYESMRGCPFTCKFCSYPFATTEWRYKSSAKIVRDWTEYAEKNGAKSIRALDSTFTVPPPRFRELLAMLPAVPVEWEAYTRANVISSREIVKQLEDSHCRYLFIGYESMSDNSLKYMDKKVSAAQNRRAHDAFAGSTIDVHGSFMVGYPGETISDFEITRRYLVDEYNGRFGLHFFGMQDETMPVWQDAEFHQLEVGADGYSWKHAGMDSDTALDLREQTLTEVRWKSENALLQLWQPFYERPFVPHLDLPTNRRIEKLIERIAFVAKDMGTGESGEARCRSLLAELEALGVDAGGDATPIVERPLMTTAAAAALPA